MAWRDAYGVLRAIAAELRPHVRRLKAAGSIRRQRPHVRDLELVLEPNMIEVDLLGTEGPDTREIRRVLHRAGTWVKGGERMMQIADVDGRGITLDVYLVHPPAQWGSILAIRTGPKELGSLAMMRLTDRQLAHVDGHVINTRTRAIEPTPDEESFFRLAGLPCWPPEQRDQLVERIRSGQDIEGMRPRV